MITREDLWEMSRAELGATLAAGHPIDLEALRGPYRGVSLGLGGLIERLSWKTFRKRFERGAGAGDIIGHNERLRQTGLHGPAEPMRDRRGKIKSFGPFRVAPLPPGGSPFHCRAGVLLDYSAFLPSYSPLSKLRDPLVAVNEGSSELLLGASYLAIGNGIKTPSYFTLEPERPST